MTDERKHQNQALFWSTLPVLLILAVLTLQEIVLPFVAGLVIAYALNPVADRIERLVLLLLIVVVMVFVFLVPILVRQAKQLIGSIPCELERFQRERQCLMP